MVKIILLWEISILNNNLFDVTLKKAIFQTDLFLGLIDISVDLLQSALTQPLVGKKMKNYSGINQNKSSMHSFTGESSCVVFSIC